MHTAGLRWASGARLVELEWGTAFESYELRRRLGLSSLFTKFWICVSSGELKE